MPSIAILQYLGPLMNTTLMRRLNACSHSQKRICLFQSYDIVDQSTDPSGGDWSKLAPSEMTDFFTENGFV